MSDSPEIISVYHAAADAQDGEAMAACFTPDGYVVDEGNTYRGHDEIVAWRKVTASKWTYTSTVTGRESSSDRERLVFVHLEGDFPCGTADVTYRFTIDGDKIAALTIG